MPESRRIRVELVDDIADTRDNISKLLYFEPDIEVIGTAANGQQAVDMAKELRPDIVVMDLSMPGRDGISATEEIQSLGLRSEVIMMSVQDDFENLRRSMLAGAREYLVKPFTGEDLALTIRRVYERSSRTESAAQVMAVEDDGALNSSEGYIISVYSPKGGVGRTTIACNLAVALKAQTRGEVALVDCNFQFGDVGVFLNLQPSKTIVDLMPHVASLEPDLFRELLIRHSSGVEVLLGPSRPEMAELVSADGLRRILSKMRNAYEYIVLDTCRFVNDTTLTALDVSDLILLLLTLQMPAIKNIRIFLEVADKLGYSADKLMLVLNGPDSAGGVGANEVAANLGLPIAARVADDPRLLTQAVTQGVPFVTLNERSAASRGILELAASVPARAGKSTENGHAANGKLSLGKLGQLIRLPARH